MKTKIIVSNIKQKIKNSKLLLLHTNSGVDKIKQK